MNALLSLLLDKLRNEPAVVAGALAAVIVFVAGSQGIVLDEPTVTSVLTPLIVGIVVRFKVMPSRKVVTVNTHSPQGEAIGQAILDIMTGCGCAGPCDGACKHGGSL